MKETQRNAKKRSIILAGFAVEALKAHRARQEEMRRAAGNAWEDHDYVFCNADGTHLNPDHAALVQLKKLLEKEGLPDIRFHDLRHSTATLLLSKGVHPKVVQELLGHSAIQKEEREESRCSERVCGWGKPLKSLARWRSMASCCRRQRSKSRWSRRWSRTRDRRCA